MEKIKVMNVRTGKVSEITKIAYEQLKKGGHAKNFDVLQDLPKKEIKFNVSSPVGEPEPEPEHSVQEEAIAPKTKRTKTKA